MTASGASVMRFFMNARPGPTSLVSFNVFLFFFGVTGGLYREPVESLSEEGVDVGGRLAVGVLSGDWKGL